MQQRSVPLWELYWNVHHWNGACRSLSEDCIQNFNPCNKQYLLPSPVATVSWAGIHALCALAGLYFRRRCRRGPMTGALFAAGVLKGDTIFFWSVVEDLAGVFKLQSLQLTGTWELFLFIAPHCRWNEGSDRKVTLQRITGTVRLPRHKWVFSTALPGAEGGDVPGTELQNGNTFTNHISWAYEVSQWEQAFCKDRFVWAGSWHWKFIFR